MIPLKKPVAAVCDRRANAENPAKPGGHTPAITDRRYRKNGFCSA